MIPIGPFRTLTSADGANFPYYIIPFDKDGNCEGPKTLEHLLANAAGYSDVFVFAHGWNNDWSAATERYEHFINGFIKLRADRKLPVPAGYRPLLVGIFWPSQALTWFDSEVGPEIAAADGTEGDKAMDAIMDLVRDIAGSLEPEKRPRFYELVESETLQPADATELAETLAALIQTDQEGVEISPTAADLIAAAQSMTAVEPDYEVVGTVEPQPAGDTPAAAFGFGSIVELLDPRNLVKPFTVWQMKDRAGRIGSRGVAKMLEDLVTKTTSGDTESSARIHLLGHSYGCKVVMSAAAAAKLSRQLHSATLFQPAISQYAFAREIPGRKGTGGFYKVLQRIERPIVATFSEHDGPLTGLFHIALRRHDDLGELKIAGAPPSEFGALGGFGPQPPLTPPTPIKDPVDPYDFGKGGRIIGIDGTRTIKGHGKISHPSAWWTAYSSAYGK